MARSATWSSRPSAREVRPLSTGVGAAAPGATESGPPQSALGRWYDAAYAALAGQPPLTRPWHHQWLASLYLRQDLARVLASCTGVVVDVGCGIKPYAAFATRAERYVGLDVFPGPAVDHLIVPGQPWPLPDASADVVLCTQVLEHVGDPDEVMTEIRRVLRPGGRAICTVPFMYNEHGSPHDFRRLSVRAAPFFERHGFACEEAVRQGAVGSTLVVTLNNWLEAMLNGSRAGRLVKGLVLPLWLVWSGVVNAAGWVVDRLDGTGLFYSNVMFLLRRP